MLPPQSGDANLTSSFPSQAAENGHTASALVPVGPMLNQVPGLAWPGAAPTRPAILSAPPDPVTLMHAFRRRWVQALGVGMLLAGVLIVLTWVLIPNEYQVNALFDVRPAAPDPFDDSRHRPDRFLHEGYKRTQLGYVKSDMVLTVALRPRAGRVDIAQLPVLKNQVDKRLWLQEELAVDYLVGGDLLRIGMSGEDPQQLVEIVNAVADAYETEVVGDEEAQMRTSIDAVTTVLAATKDKIKRLTEKYENLMKTTNSAESETVQHNIRMILDTISNLRREQQDIARLLRDIDSLIGITEASIEKATEPQSMEYVVRTEMMRDPRYQDLQLRMMEMDRSHASTTALVANTNSPLLLRYTSMKEALETEKQELEDELRPLIVEALHGNMIPQHEIDLALFKKQKESIEAELKESETAVFAEQDKLKTLGIVSGELEQVIRELDDQSTIAAEYRQRLSRLSSLMQQTDKTRIKKVSEATMPDGNDVVMKYLLVGFTGCLGMAMAVCGVTYHEFQRRKVNCASEVSEGLGLRVVGALPSLNGRGKAAREGLLQGMLSESIDSVRTTLLHAASSDATRVVMVTSAVDQEGKTTVASQLAASLARCGRRTLLIDGDVRSPSAHELFDTPLDPGFCEVLRGEADAEDAIRPTRAPGLWVMAAGRCDVDAIQALAKDAVGSVFEAIRPDFDFIVVDSAPVLTLSDSLSLGQHVDAAILSVLRDVSQTPKVYQASELLKSVGVNVLGAVVNGEACSTHRRMSALPSPN